MKAFLALLISCFALSNLSFAQTSVRKLPTNINHPSINVSVPFMSLDGNSMVLLSDNTEDNKIAMFFTTKADAVNWKDPVMMPRTVNTGLNFLKGFTLSGDGKTLYLSSSRTGGLGNFDIYKVDQKGTAWGDFVNLGMPINSKENDSSPTFSADGNTMYFMRCEKMTFDKAENCKIVMSKKNATGQWQQPMELPAFINTGNSQSPRIMADGETLIFSSNKFAGSKGGMDLYMSRWNGTTWSNPVALDFANTAADDQYISVTSAGRYLLRDAPGARKSELVELIFPATLKPKATMKIEGTVNTTAYVSVVNKKDQSRVFNGRPNAAGQFVLYLNEGAIYDLSIEGEKDNFNFYSKEFDLTKDRIPQLEKITATLKPVASGDVIDLAGVSFKANSFEIDPASNQELRKLTRMIKGNPALKFTIDVSLYGYRQDSIRTDADMTETYADTMRIQVPYTIIDTTAVDSVKTMLRDSLVIKKMYHNDRTPHQALELVNYLVTQGVPAKNLSVSHQAIAALPENRKLLVKVIVK